MNITLTIQAPGLEKALENLSIALQGGNAPISATLVQQSEPIQQAPVQQSIQQPVPPAAVPTSTPMQQPVTQSAPLQQQPVQQPQMQQPVPQQPLPTTQSTYSMDQLAVAATQLMDAGKREQLMQLLAAFGVQALTSLPQEQYGAFATKLRELGANI